MKTIEVISLKKQLIVLLALLMAVMLLVSCGRTNPDITPGGNTPTSTQQTNSSNENTTGSTETPGTTGSVTDETSTSTPDTDEPVTDSTETTGTTETPGTTVPPVTDPPSTTRPTDTTPPSTEPETSTPPVTVPTETEPTVPTYVPSTSLSVSFVSYSSGNEAKPYLKGDAIYSILYKGARAQVGDTLVYEISVLPANHSDTILLSATDNLPSYSKSSS